MAYKALLHRWKTVISSGGWRLFFFFSIAATCPIWWRLLEEDMFTGSVPTNNAPVLGEERL